MDRSMILPLAVLTVLLAVIATVLADEVKHKRVIVKVPKKINHVHHHHVKKIHIYKHKPKPIHSIHVIEEDEPIGKGWKNKFNTKHSKQAQQSRHKGSFGGGWKHEEGDEDEYKFGEEEYEEDEEEGYHKSGSQNEPTIWKGKKNNGKWNDHRGGSNKGRTSGRSSWKGDRSKRQKNPGSIYRPVLNSHLRPQIQKKPKKTNRTPKSKKSKKPRPYQPVDKEYSDYGEYYDDVHFNDSPIWPERKEHISWHMREPTWSQMPVLPLATQRPHYVVEDFRTEHNGEINLVKPEIKEVQAPQLGPKLIAQDPTFWTKQLDEESQMWANEMAKHPQLWTKDVIQEPNFWSKELIQQPQLWTKDVIQDPQTWSKPGVREQVWKNPLVQEQVWTKPVVQEQVWTNPVVQEQVLQAKPVTQEQEWTKPVVQTPKKLKSKKKVTRKPVVQEHKETNPTRPEGYRTEVEHSGTGYSSHVGHTAEGDSASFQSVRFGDKIRSR